MFIFTHGNEFLQLFRLGVSMYGTHTYYVTARAVEK